jgi:hypothetical protein
MAISLLLSLQFSIVAENRAYVSSVAVDTASGEEADLDSFDLGLPPNSPLNAFQLTGKQPSLRKGPALFASARHFNFLIRGPPKLI